MPKYSLEQLPSKVAGFTDKMSPIKLGVKNLKERSPLRWEELIDWLVGQAQDWGCRNFQEHQNSGWLSLESTIAYQELRDLVHPKALFAGIHQ